MTTLIDLTGPVPIVTTRKLKRKRETIPVGKITKFDQGFVFSEFAGDATAMTNRVMASLAEAGLIKTDRYTLGDWLEFDEKKYFFNIFKDTSIDKSRLAGWTVSVTGAKFEWLSDYKDARAREILRDAPDGYRDISEERLAAVCAFSPNSERGQQLGELGMGVSKYLDGWVYFF